VPYLSNWCERIQKTAISQIILQLRSKLELIIKLQTAITEILVQKLTQSGALYSY
jgi:hypothetical protein